MRFPLRSFLTLASVCCFLSEVPAAAAGKSTASPGTPSTAVEPAYPVPYGLATASELNADLDRVLVYLEASSPAGLVDLETGETVVDAASISGTTALTWKDFRVTSYEWGVTYSGMLLAGQHTRNPRYQAYVESHLSVIAALARQHERTVDDHSSAPLVRGIRNVLRPKSLDDSGAMAASMLRAVRAGIRPDLLQPCIDRYLSWISKSQLRLEDGTLARNRPMPGSLWLDDLYMSVPALAEMGALTGDPSYFDDAAKQVLQFSERMFVSEKRLYRHGWVESMQPHPSFHWARANGWAILAMADLLARLPVTHPRHAAILHQFREHIAGLAAVQDASGLWHQLLDRPDSYLETSASAMFVYAMAKGVNEGWLDLKAYGPCLSIGWSAVSKKINGLGQVEGTCVGTGMGFDPMFYYYRPTDVFAAHGYGPVLLAGAEVLRFREGKGASALIHDGGLHFEKATGH